MCFAAFSPRLRSACSSRSRFVSTARPSATSTSTATPACGWSPAATSRRSGASSTASTRGGSCPECARASVSIARASRASRPASRSMWPRKRSRSAGSSFAPAWSTSTAPMIVVSGVRSSCAAFETNSRSASSRRSCSVRSSTTSSAQSVSGWDGIPVTPYACWSSGVTCTCVTRRPLVEQAAGRTRGDRSPATAPAARLPRAGGRRGSGAPRCSRSGRRDPGRS